MRSFLSLKSRVLAATVTAAALGAGVLAGAPAASARLPGVCAWLPLSLLNGWQSEQSAWDTGNPVYCVNDGITYLAGSLAQPGGGGMEFAVLPPSAAPASTVYLSVYTSSGVAGVLRILPDGEMDAYNGDATQFTSLAGISFVQAQSDESAQPLPLNNGWQSAGSQYGTGDPAYFQLADGVVHLSGSIKSSSYFPGFAAMPTGLAPASDDEVDMNTYTYGGVVGELSADGTGDPSEPSGGFAVQSEEGGPSWANPANFTSLAGISYPAGNVAWQPLALQPTWYYENGGGDINGPPSYWISQGVVYLAGGVGQNPANGIGGVFAILPPAARPAHDLYFIGNAEGLPYVGLEIEPNGDMNVFGGGGPDWFSLGGLSYQVTS